MSTAVFTWGRFNPPTIGHSKLIDKVKKIAKKEGGTPHIYMSHSQDDKRNPLDYNTKYKVMRKIFGSAVTKSNARTIMDVMKDLDRKGYDDVILVAGSDRVKEFEKLLDKYNGKEYEFDSIKVVSAGERDPDEAGAGGMSASKMRAAVSNDDFKLFQKGMPKEMSNAEVKSLYKELQGILSEDVDFDGDIDITDTDLDAYMDLAYESDIDEEDEDEEEVNEIMNIAQRKKVGLRMKKLMPKIQRKKKMNQKKMASSKSLQKRANKAAINLIRKKVAGKKGMKYASLSTAEKMSVDKLVAKKRGKAAKIAKRLMPKIRKAEQERLQKFRAKTVENVEQYMEARRIKSKAYDKIKKRGFMAPEPKDEKKAKAKGGYVKMAKKGNPVVMNVQTFKIPYYQKKGYEIVESLTEATLSPSNFDANPARYDTFQTKIDKGQPFEMKGGGTVILDPFPYPEDAKKLPKLTGKIDGAEESTPISWSKLEKTAEFGGQGSSGKPSGAQWEALIAIGVKFANSHDIDKVKKTPEWKEAGKFWDDYGKYANKLGEEFKSIFSLGDLEQLGGSTRPTNSKWLGSNKTPKTDLIEGKNHISLKKSGGSQLMSAGKEETMSTFNAALQSFSKANSGEVLKLIKQIDSKMNGLSSPGRINDIKKLSKKKTLTAKEIQQTEEYEALWTEAKKIEKQMDKVFSSLEFKSHFCWEAATGENKFAPSPDAIANSIVTFNPNGKVDDVLKLDSIMTAGKKLAKGNDFYVSFKTGGGGSKPYLSLRTKKFKFKESFGDIVRTEFNKHYWGQEMLAEANVMQLDEYALFDKLKKNLSKAKQKVSAGLQSTVKQLTDIFDAIMKKISGTLQYISTLGKNMLNALLDFFGIEVDKIKVKGGGKYPLV